MVGRRHQTIVVGDGADLFGQPMWSAAEVLRSPSCVPAAAGVYGFWFDEIPPLVPTQACETRLGHTLLYVGISPGAPPRNGRPPSRQTMRDRVRYHYRGNAEGSTLRLTLGVLLAEPLGLQLRRVGSGRRMTFSDGERVLSEWMAEHARVSVVEHPEPWLLEEHLIASLSVPLNLDGNTHPFRPTLSAMRSAAKQHARTGAVLEG